MQTFEHSGCLQLNKAAWFVFQARVGAILCLLLSTPSLFSDSLDELAEVGAPCSLLPCFMGPEAALTPPREGAGQRQLSACSSAWAGTSSYQTSVPPAHGLQQGGHWQALLSGSSPAQLTSSRHRHGGHLPAPGWICLQFCRVDRGGSGNGHQWLGGDLWLHHYHLQENGWAGIQRAVGRLCHGYRSLSLQAPRGHPHPAR